MNEVYNVTEKRYETPPNTYSFPNKFNSNLKQNKPINNDYDKDEPIVLDFDPPNPDINYVKDQYERYGKILKDLNFKKQTESIQDTASFGTLKIHDEMIKDMKYDKGKLLAAIPFEDFPLALREIAKICDYGANKYERHSWKTVPNAKIRYKDAMFRHLLCMLNNEEYDEESNLLHQAHFAWNVLALLQLKLEEE